MQCAPSKNFGSRQSELEPRNRYLYPPILFAAIGLLPSPGSRGAMLAATLTNRVNSGLDPLDVARCVVTAIRQNELYVFTHAGPEWRSTLEGRSTLFFLRWTEQQQLARSSRRKRLRRVRLRLNSGSPAVAGNEIKPPFSKRARPPSKVGNSRICADSDECDYRRKCQLIGVNLAWRQGLGPIRCAGRGQLGLLNR
jgi:hypothetical protein